MISDRGTISSAQLRWLREALGGEFAQIRGMSAGGLHYHIKRGLPMRGKWVPLEAASQWLDKYLRDNKPRQDA